MAGGKKIRAKSETLVLRERVQRLEAQLKLQQSIRRTDSFTKLTEKIFDVLGRVAPWFFAYLGISALAGEVTIADINFAASFEGFETVIDLLKNYLGEIVGVGGFGYGIINRRMLKKERNLRRNTIEHMQGRIKELEEEKDPNRSSSTLTPTGETNPEDI